MLSPAQHEDLAAQIRAAIDNNSIQLPTLPEVALQVRDAVERDSTNAAEVAAMVGKDAALSARLLQVANSPLYRGRSEIDSIQQAVTRLGLKMVRSLVVSLAMKQIFQATSDALDREFRKVWDDSLQVAAISRVLAGNVPELENEQAMLGGLIHNIGALPILTKVDEVWGFDADHATIQALISDLAPEIGARILEHWHFAESLANIPTAAYDLGYNPGPVPTYADIVLVARLQNLASKGGDGMQADWADIPAFAKVGVEHEVVIIDMEGPAEEIAEVRSMLEG
ncbi:MAG: HDOD domain-containing protein [Gammaproteobacteria bacterium]|nr:HDOD domain-containing protein [Gammaproteobacteria bacterium]